ncbi:MAG: glycosyltransferase family 2 protein, partial [Tsuneonella sp.]
LTLILEEVQLRRVPRARDLAVLAIIAVVENLGYRQLSNLWRLKGWWQFVRRDQGWGAMTRKGFGGAQP